MEHVILLIVGAWLSWALYRENRPRTAIEILISSQTQIIHGSLAFCAALTVTTLTMKEFTEAVRYFSEKFKNMEDS